VDLGLHAHFQQADRNVSAGVPVTGSVTTVGTPIPTGGSANLAPAGDPSNWGVGVNVGFDAFTVGMNYAEVDADIAGTSAGDSTHLALGATYNTGVWTFGADYIMQDNKGVSSTTAGADIEQEAYRIGASRDLGPGVAWDIFAISYDGDDKGCAGANCTDVDGQMIGTAITLNF